MRERLEGLAYRAEKKRGSLPLLPWRKLVSRTLQESDFTASLRPCPPHLVVLSDEQIPEGFWIPQAPRLDRQSILIQLKQGKEVPGTALSNPALTWAVRTK